ncbi:MAG: hypothetical protein JSR19_08210 [Proteobacteria bacterium]|nr:hypothetical protein [Pseudomonadota bacterium]HQR04422.1 hypothetical protein [Rhodocyclaceae bacterium]
MPAFENYSNEAANLETEIVRKAVILGIDWNDEAQVRKLARQALSCNSDQTIKLDCAPGSPEGMAKLELFALAQLMMKVMEEAAGEGIEVHGGPVWKLLARALWAARGEQGG